MWCVPKVNKEFVDKMEDVLSVYERPYNSREPVVCLDERPVQLRDCARASTHGKPGKIAKQDYEYVRRGTANVFCGIEPLKGRHFTRATPNRTAPQFAEYLRAVARSYPGAKTIHAVVDNLNTHCLKSLTRWFGPRRGAALWNRFTFHFTPKHGSWLNQAEIEISVMSRQCLSGRRIPDLRCLRRETSAWDRRANRDELRIRWGFSRRDARKTFRYKLHEFTRSED